MPQRPGKNQKRLPLLPLSGEVLLPQGTLTLPGFSDWPGALRKQARAGNLHVLVVPSPAGGQIELSRPRRESRLIAWPRIGVEAVVGELVTLPNGDLGAVVRGLERRRIGVSSRVSSNLFALVSPMRDKACRTPKPLIRAVHLAAERVARLKAGADPTRAESLSVSSVRPRRGEPRQFSFAALAESEQAEALSFFAASLLQLPFADKVFLLNSTDLVKRLRFLLKALAQEAELLSMATAIKDAAEHAVDEGQRRHLLKEQIRRLQAELDEGLGDELEKLKNDLATLELPGIVRDVVARELGRMDMMPPGSPDYMVAHSYLTWIQELPWGPGSNLKTPNMRTARRHLSKHHFGLLGVKERILEYLAVMRRQRQAQGEILLLVGPPGVGKSSLARQIASALGRPFAAVALGGVKDEAEVRGHRRTYVGSMPGKIIHALRQTKSNAPVILLDEIDKVGFDHGRGAVANALLEVLDYTQNHRFTDHYMAIPYDLSRVVFIATANSVQGLQSPLLDRMEVVDLASYTEQEKLKIAQKHLLPELRREFGLRPRQLQLNELTLLHIIRAYTREAGVRELRRCLAALGRKTVKMLAEGRRLGTLNVGSLASFLGPPKFLDEPSDARLSPGVALGLAYTEIGGDILYIESARLPSGGKAELTLTGSLGKVMKESAYAALAYLRSLAYASPHLLPFDVNVIADSHIHLHLPQGATPKDGPSAGLAIICAVASLLGRKSLPSGLAMSGEITLRGQVLPIGGLKEKLLAAHRYGKTRVIIPAGNQQDLAHLPKDVRRGLEIIPVERVAEALAVAGLTSVNSAHSRPVASIAALRTRGEPSRGLKRKAGR